MDRIRKTILELLMSHAPDSPELKELAERIWMQTETVLKKRLHFVFIVVYVSDTVPRL